MKENCKITKNKQRRYFKRKNGRKRIRKEGRKDNTKTEKK